MHDLKAESIEDDSACTALLEYLRTSRGFDFTGYKRPSLMRRMLKRMQSVDIHNCADYIDFLEVHPDEFTELFDTILINVTSFFRDPQTWEVIDNTVLPRILAARGIGGPIRIWSAGCASGEEPYTIAMLLAEKLGIDAVRERVKIYATDADERALQQARQAVYSEHAVSAVPEELRDKYFKKSGAAYAFNVDLRRNVVFGRHEMIHDAPISRLDLLTCRNALMYFNTETQGKIMARFHFALNPDAFLVLGKAEMLFTHANAFTAVDLKRRIFSKIPQYRLDTRILPNSPVEGNMDDSSLSPLLAAQN